MRLHQITSIMEGESVLEEVRPAILYHATHPGSALSIIKDGRIKGKFDYSKEIKKMEKYVNDPKTDWSRGGFYSTPEAQEKHRKYETDRLADWKRFFGKRSTTISTTRDKRYIHNQETSGGRDGQGRRNNFGDVVFHIDQERLKQVRRMRAGHPRGGPDAYKQVWVNKDIPLKYVTHISLGRHAIGLLDQTEDAMDEPLIKDSITQALKDAGHTHITVGYHKDTRAAADGAGVPYN